MAPWELPEFLKEKVERGRRCWLNGRSTEATPTCRQSEEKIAKEAFIQDMELTVALHRTFLNEDGQPRLQGVPERELYQGIVIFQRGMLFKLMAPVYIGILDSLCLNALAHAVTTLVSTARSDALTLLGRLGSVAVILAKGKLGCAAATYAPIALSLEWSSCRAAVGSWSGTCVSIALTRCCQPRICTACFC